MKNITTLAYTILIVTSIQCCATKTYGRQSSLTTFEKTTMSCREIDLDIAKTKGFIDHVNKEAEFSGRDVLAFLGDFGIGNNLERTAALKSANTRISDLEKQRQANECDATTAQP